MPFSDSLRLSRLFRLKMSDEKYSFNPDTWNKEKKIGLTSDLDLISGWGNVTHSLLNFSKNIDIRWSGRLANCNDGYIRSLLLKEIPTDAAMIYHEQPKDYWNSSPFGFNLAIVPFETTRIPESWVSRLNKFNGLMVPCKQNIQMMRDSGVTIPIELIHWGVNDELYYPLERNNSVFTFGTMGALSVRKGTDLLVTAFEAAFPKKIKDVQLICKSSHSYYPFMVRDDRIKVDLSILTHSELLTEFFKNIDVFVFPTRGEGFGLPPLEAMATGVPAIVTNWSGPEEFMNKEVGWTLSYKMKKAEEFDKNVYKEDCGEWAEPNFDELVEAMRYAYYHQDEVSKKGKTAAQNVYDNWLWKDKIKMFHEAIDKLINVTLPIS